MKTSAPDPVLTIEDFDYSLPKELIAQTPLKDRASSRLLVVHRASGRFEDRQFSDVKEYLQAGDRLVLNDSKVFPARLAGHKETGGKAEILLVSPTEDCSDTWKVLVRPNLKESQTIHFKNTDASGRVAGRSPDGYVLMKFQGMDVRSLAEKIGAMPLPPYIKRDPSTLDHDRYQTVYADSEGSIAAPTAGLHWTPDLLDKVKKKGVACDRVTLHVGYGTFQMVRDPENHRMHAEHFQIKAETAEAINQALDEGKKIWAVGTTSVRVLETCVIRKRVVHGEGTTNLFIQPGFPFEVVGGMITNFHLPRSTLLMLVSAFMGHELLRRAYEHAVRNGYRFYSYGDAMLIV